MTDCLRVRFRAFRRRFPRRMLLAGLAAGCCLAQQEGAPENLALGSRVSASSSYNSELSGSGCAVDGDPLTWWRHLSRDQTPWLQLDLGAPTTFGAVLLREYLRNGAYRIRGYRLEASVDGESWQILDAKMADPPSRSPVGAAGVVAFPDVLARYIRFTITARDPADIAGLFELEVYADEGAARAARARGGYGYAAGEGENRGVRLIVTDTVAGRSLPRVGYSMSRVIEGTDKLRWLRYSQVNAVRYWVSPPRHVPEDCLSTDTVPDLATFERLRSQFRENPRSNPFIDWERVRANMTFMVDRRNRSAYTIDWTLAGIRALGIEVCAELNHGRWDDTWETAWRNWRQIYATAFHLARYHGVTLFQTPNEPDHPHQRALHGNPDRVLRVLRLYSDAVRGALEDVNRLDGSALVPRLAGPVLAGRSGGDYDMPVIRTLYTDYRGQTVNHRILDIYNRQRYSSNPEVYGRQIDQIREMLIRETPDNQALPIIYTEWNWSTGARWRSRPETGDTPAVFCSVAGTWGLAMRHGAHGMYLFKFANTADVNGNWVHYERLVHGREMPNVARGAAVIGTPDSTAERIVDGMVDDSAAWISDEDSPAPQVLEVDLGRPRALRSVVIYAGMDDGSARPSSLALQQLIDDRWQDISLGRFGGSPDPEKPLPGVIHATFPDVVTTSRVRLVIGDPGRVCIRELVLREGPVTFEIGGPLKSAEVTRLFAGAFAGGHPLLETRLEGAAAGLQAHAAENESRDRLSLWIVRRDPRGKVELTLDLAQAGIASGSDYSVREVSATAFGDVTRWGTVPTENRLRLSLPPQCVWLVTVARRPAAVQRTLAAARFSSLDSSGRVADDSPSAEILCDPHRPWRNQRCRAVFDLGGIDVSTVRCGLLQVEAQVTEGASSPTSRLCVYAPAPGHDQPVSQMTVDAEPKIRTVDVTEHLRTLVEARATFDFVGELRYAWERDRPEKTRLTATGSQAPRLLLWLAPPTPAPEDQ